LNRHPGFSQDRLENKMLRGLDESGKPSILLAGSGESEPFRGITVGSKKVLPSERSSEGQK